MLSQELQKLPKVELHCHFDGSVPLATLKKLAIKDGYPLDKLDLASAPERCLNLEDYLRAFDVILPLLQSEENLRIALMETVAAIAADGVTYLELRFAPLLHTNGGLTSQEVVTILSETLVEISETYPIYVNLLLCFMRHHDMASHTQLLQDVGQLNLDNVVGFDAAGAEPDGCNLPLKDLMAEVTQRGFDITLHAGECGCPQNVVEAIEIGAKRIGHGVAIAKDIVALNFVKSHDVLLEMCPTSNLQTLAVDTWDSYPLQTFLAQDVKVAISTDNRTVSKTSLTGEFEKLFQYCHLTQAQMKTLQVNAIRHSFAKPDVKAFVENTIQTAYKVF